MLKGFLPLINLVLDKATIIFCIFSASGILKGFDPLVKLVLDEITIMFYIFQPVAY